MQGHTIQTDRTLLRLIKLVEQVHNGALACTAETYQCRNLTALDTHRHIVECLGAVAIREVHVLQLEVACHLLWLMLPSGLHLLVGLKDAEEAFGVDQGVVHIVIDTVQLSDGGADIGEEHHVIHDLTNRHTWVIYQHQISRQDDDEHGAYLFQETFQAIEQVSLFAGVQLQVGHRTLDACLTVGLYLLTVERLDDSDALDDVQNTLTHSLMPAEDTSATAFHAGGLDIGHPEIERYDTKCYQTHIDIGSKHQY